MLGTLVDMSGVGERTYETELAPAEVDFSLDRPDLRIGASGVRLGSDASYELAAKLPEADGPDTLSVRLTIRAPERRYVPPVEIGGGLVSGYAVPILAGAAEGEICAHETCFALQDAHAYHDHNWGTWRDVTWDWGTLRAGPYALVYGGVLASGAPAGSRFLFLTDSLGFRQIFDIEAVSYEWRSRPADVRPQPRPTGVRLAARAGRDSLVVTARASHIRVTEIDAAGEGPRRRFFQIRGTATLSGSLGSETIGAAGDGFFETWSVERTERPLR